LKMQNWNL